MAIQQTLQDLRQRFYDRFDEGASQYIDTNQANRLINEGGRWLHNWIISSSEDYIVSKATINVNANQADYPLPADFFKDLKVFGVGTLDATNPPYHWALRRLMKNEYHGGSATAFRLPFTAPYGYMITGQILTISPVPSEVSFNIEMWYAPHYAEMVNDADTCSSAIVPGWDEFIVNHAVIAAKIKEEADTGAIQQRQAEVRAMITEQMVNRDMGMPQRVTDVTSGGPWGGLGWPGGFFT